MDMSENLDLTGKQMGFKTAKIGFKARKPGDGGFVQDLGVHQTSVRGSFTRMGFYSSTASGWSDRLVPGDL